jgi:hypothetical protein
VLRAGAHLTLAPGSDIVASAILDDSTRHLSFTFDDELFEDEFRAQLHTEDLSFEVQHIYKNSFGSLATGIINSSSNRIAELEDCFSGECSEFRFERDIDARSIYAYGTWNGPAMLTVGLARERVERSTDGDDQEDSAWSPKLGIEWRPTQKLRVRTAAFRSLRRPVIETIEPTQIAGFDQLSGEFAGTKVDVVTFGADYRLTTNLTLGMEAVHRNATPTFVVVDETDDVDQVLGRQVDHEYRVFTYWTPTNRLAFSATVERSEFFQPQKEAFGQPTKIDTWLTPVQLRAVQFCGLGRP